MVLRTNPQEIESELWEKKVLTLLHDPPHKSIVSWLLKQKHEEKAENLRDILALNDQYNEIKSNIIIPADHFASSLSRILIDSYRSVEKRIWKEITTYNEILIIDPLSAESKSVKISNYQQLNAEIEKIFELINKYYCNYEPQPDFRKLFLLFYSIYPELLIRKSNFSNFPLLSLPADTRACNHSIYSHLIESSAIATATDFSPENPPVLLLFTIGPVQSFIAQARKTSDLWAGSFLLSYLTWKSIEEFFIQQGPDNIIFPHLRKQPFFRKYICQNEIVTNDFYQELKNKFANKNNTFLTVDPKSLEEFIGLELSSDDISISTIPNRFLAITSKRKANEQATNCEETLKRKWSQLIYKSLNYLLFQLDQCDQEIPIVDDSINYFVNDKTVDDKFKDLWSAFKRQSSDFFKIYWVYVPFGAGKSFYKNKKDILQCLDIYDKINDCNNTTISNNNTYNKSQSLRTIINSPYYKTGISTGSFYSLIYELTEKLLFSRKKISNFQQIDEPGRKCSLCGERTELSFYFNSKNIWKKIRRKRPSLINEHERLCAICWTKRILPFLIKDEFKDIKSLNDEQNTFDKKEFPSTSEISCLTFKKGVIEAIKEGNNEIEKKLTDFIDSLSKLQEKIKTKFKKTNFSTRGIKKLLIDINDETPDTTNTKNYKELLKKFVNIEGSLFYEETYQDSIMKKVYFLKDDDLFNKAKEDIIKVKDSLKKLYKSIESYNLSRPSKPPKPSRPSKYYALLMMDGDDMGKWLKGEKSPSLSELIHYQLRDSIPDESTSTGTSLQEVFSKQHPLSPSFHAEFSEKLSVFSLKTIKEIVKSNYGVLIYSGGDDVLALLPVEQVLLAADEIQRKFRDIFGKKGSMSAGIIVAHHKQNLRNVLTKVRDAEKDAKKLEKLICNHKGGECDNRCQLKKDGFKLTVMKHSGSELSIGLKWNYHKRIKSIDFINLFIEAFSEEKVSRNFPYLLYENLSKFLEFDNSSDDLNKDVLSDSLLFNIIKGEIERISGRTKKDTQINQIYYNDLFQQIFTFMEEIKNLKLLLDTLLIARFISGLT